jgi:cell division protein FtsQ
MAQFARRRPGRLTRVALCVAVALAVLTPLALWLRSSSLVRVTHVTISGIDGRQAAQIRAVLTSAGEDMTTLDVRDDALRSAVAPYPIVRSLRTETDFPHGLRIIVNAYDPVGALEAGGGRVTAFAGDGTLLRGTAARDLPLVAVKTMPAGDRVGDPQTMGAVNLLATAPAPLRARVVRLYRGSRGWAMNVENGPKLYFGGASRLEAKWSAAAQVLANRLSRGAAYVDVRVPERPVAGGLKPRSPEAQPQL